MLKVYHRLWSEESQNDEVLRKQIESRQIWGHPRRNIHSGGDPCVKAFAGELPPEAKGGVEFKTDIPPRLGCHPDIPDWVYDPPDVDYCPGKNKDDCDCVFIEVTITKYKYSDQEMVAL